MKKKVVITGGNGFVGSHLVTFALDQGYEVHVMVRDKSGIAYIDGLDIKLHRVNYQSYRSLKSSFDTIGCMTCQDYLSNKCQTHSPTL